MDNPVDILVKLIAMFRYICLVDVQMNVEKYGKLKSRVVSSPSDCKYRKLEIRMQWASCISTWSFEMTSKASVRSVQFTGIYWRNQIETRKTLSFLSTKFWNFLLLQTVPRSDDRRLVWPYIRRTSRSACICCVGLPESSSNSGWRQNCGRFEVSCETIRWYNKIQIWKGR